MNDTAIQAVYPMTATQRSMVAEAQAHGGGVYLDQASMQLSGSLDVDRFVASWRAVVAAEPVLRTAFAWEREKPVQVVLATADLPVHVENLGGLSESARRSRVDAVLTEDANTPVDVHRPPLMRLTILQLEPCEHLVVWTHHHALLDGWSVALLAQRVAEHYQTGATRVSGADTWAFRGFSRWLQTRSTAEDEDFWREELRDVTPSRLPGLMLDAKRVSDGPGSIDLTLDAATTESINAFLSEHGLTLTTLICAAWSLLVGTGPCEDVVVGFTSAGRPAHIRGVTSSLGMFVNTLPLRVPLSTTVRVDAWLNDLQQHLRKALAHEFLPLPAILEQRGIRGSGAEWMQACIVIQNTPQSESDWSSFAGLRSSGIDFQARTGFPALLMAIPATELRLRFIWEPLWLSPVVAQRLLENLPGAITALASHSDSSLDSLLATHRLNAHVGSHPQDESTSERGSASEETATRVAEILGTCLNRPRLEMEDDFFKAGGTSLTAMVACARLSQESGRDLDPRVLFHRPIVRDIAIAVETAPAVDATEHSTAEDESMALCRADALLDAASPRRRRSREEGFALTGASGFIGIHVLSELLNRTNEPVYCLSRAADNQAFREQLRAALALHGLASELADLERIVFLHSEPSAHGLGLDPSARTALSAARHIYHLAGSTSHAAPYAELRGTATLGMRSLLALATANAIPLHVLSTAAVLGVGDGPQNEDTPPGPLEQLNGGYAQAKWVAESLCLTARQMGHPASVYRLVRVSGSRHHGTLPENDTLWRFLEGCIQLGSAPDAIGQVRLVAVDELTDALLRLSSLPANTYHLMTGGSLSIHDFADSCCDMGFPVDVIPLDEWERRLVAQPENPANAIAPMLRATIGHRTADLDGSRTLAQLAALGGRLRPVDRSDIDRYVTRLTAAGLAR